MKRLQLFFFALLFASFSSAAVLCETVFSGDTESAWRVDPKASLQTVLQTDARGFKSGRARRKIEKLRLDKPVSESQIRLLVRFLFESRFDDMNHFRMILKSKEDILDAQVSRMLAEETARRGLKSFYESQARLNPQDTVWTKLKLMLASPEAARVGSMLSVLTLSSRVPFLTFPVFRSLKLSQEQFDTLLLEGRESPAGQKIVQEIMPAGMRDYRFAIFAKTFNRISLVTALYFLAVAQSEILDADARANGELFMQQLHRHLEKIEAKAPEDEATTPADIEYDEVVESLQKRNGRLSLQDLVVICGEIRAPNRCR